MQIKWTEADVIHRLRVEAKLNQTDLHRLTGVAPNTLSQLERHETNPDRSTIERLAKIFGLTYADIVNAVPREEMDLPLAVPQIARKKRKAGKATTVRRKPQKKRAG